jgi:hypothetical protein
MIVMVALEIVAIVAVIIAHRRHNKAAEFDGGFTQDNPPRVTRIRADHIIKEE